MADFSFFIKAFNFFKKLFGDNVKKEYSRFVVKQTDLSKKFVYVPLHWQPECTTSPQGGDFVDQILMLEILSASLPEEWIIYVKEHPFQWSVLGVNHYSNMRYRGYYKKIASLKNVFIIPIETNTYTLIKKAQCVATVSGRAIMEGVLRGKPGIIFGYPWFMNLPGIFRVQNVDSCRNALNAVENGFKPKQQDVINFFKSFDEVTTNGYLNKWGKEYSLLTEEENSRNILNLLINEVERN